MIINKNHKIIDLLTKYPFLKEKLIERNPKFKNLNNKAIFKTVGKFARIKDIAKVSGENLNELLSFINTSISNSN